MGAQKTRCPSLAKSGYRLGKYTPVAYMLAKSFHKAGKTIVLSEKPCGGLLRLMVKIKYPKNQLGAYGRLI